MFLKSLKNILQIKNLLLKFLFRLLETNPTRLPQ